jgi:hypothetical protein
MRFVLAALLLLPYQFAHGEKADAKPLVWVFGFLVKDGDQAVITYGRHKYSLPWDEFSTVNKVAKDHEVRQAEYKLPTQHLLVDADQETE